LEVGVVSEQIPEEAALRAWARWATGEPLGEIAAWLNRIGYRLSTDDVAVIAIRHEQQRDAHSSRTNTGLGPG
jgi:hypothetical protein